MRSGATMLFGINLEFIVFILMLIGIALLHRHALPVALAGLCCLVIVKLLFDGGFPWKEHFLGAASLFEQLHDKKYRGGEWPLLLNLFGLLIGFAVLARHFEESRVPNMLPAMLPDGWTGPLTLLVLTFVMSSFLDNIAAAMIGCTSALVIFKEKVHVGYLAAIVAASNAGGSGSVIGDTTTTMLWISGVPAVKVLHAYVAAAAAFAVFGAAASRQQHAWQPIQKTTTGHSSVDWKKIGVVFGILVLAISANCLLDFPALGVWAGILLGAGVVRTPWAEIKKSLPGSLFLLSLVTCAGLLPVEKLPPASWQSTLALGFLSSVFDNIPLTKLALDQGGYDWGFVAFAVGFGGSMIWFGSSAGVAVSGMFPEARSLSAWLKSGWHVALAYVVGFFALLLVIGWHPLAK